MAPKPTAKPPAKSTAKPPAKPEAKVKTQDEGQPRKTPDQIRQSYLERVKKSQANMITEQQAGFYKFLVNRNRQERYFCYIEGCVYGSNNRPSEVTVHKGGDPHPDVEFDVKKVITVPTQDFMRDEDLKASEEATTVEQFYEILNRNLPADADAAYDFLLTWPEAREDFEDCKGFFESEEE